MRSCCGRSPQQLLITHDRVPQARPTYVIQLKRELDVSLQNEEKEQSNT